MEAISNNKKQLMCRAGPYSDCTY